MITLLDYMLFGNGYGLKIPKFPDKVYIIDGVSYFWIGGFGAQLKSVEWFSPKIRKIGKYIIEPYNITTRWPKKLVTWKVTGVNTLEDIREFKKYLEKDIYFE